VKKQDHSGPGQVAVRENLGPTIRNASIEDQSGTVGLSEDGMVNQVVANKDEPPEESISVLTGSQLQDLIKEEALSLAEQVEQLGGELKDLKLDFEALVGTVTNQARLIKNLQNQDEKLGQTVLLRCQKIIRYINNRPDHKASLETLKGVIEIDNAKMSQTIVALHKGWSGRFVTRRIQGNEHKKELVQVKW